MQKIALIIFILSFTYFNFLLIDSNYILDKETFRAVVSDQNHYEALVPSFEKLFNISYHSNIEFISEIRMKIYAVNESYRQKQEWDKVIYTDYIFTLTKASSQPIWKSNSNYVFNFSITLMIISAILFAIPMFLTPAGIKNNGIFFSPYSSRRWLGILIGSWLIAFYVVLYFYPEYLVNWVILVDPISKYLNGASASQWFLYGFLYTCAILVMGIRFIAKYRHNRYQIIRTFSVMFFQSSFAFIFVNILQRFNLPAVDLKNIWPLDYSFFFDYRIDNLIKSGSIGYWMMGWGIALIIIAVPVLTYLYGKRWYCSWVCGCGALAETLGDPFRQLSDKSLNAWKYERIIIHSVLLFAIIMTSVVIYSYWTKETNLFGMNAYHIRSAYGFYIGAMFSGVVGTGFYPLMGNRVWCRFGCPLAAYLGIVQRFKSRFRITTNGSQCISCGNCSTYCEMGIDVRSYAQKGQDIVRASCVGCGICAAVCPRGVLKLENGSVRLDLSEIMK